MSVSFQKQTARNIVLSPNQQAAYGGQLADAKLTYRASLDASTSFDPDDKRYSDAGSVGRGTDFASVDIRTAWMTSGTVKGMGGTELWLLGWMLALAFGQDTVTGAAGGPYTHLFTIPNITAQMPCTTIYIEDTDDVHRYFSDMAAKSLSIDIPERGPIEASLEMAGTGRFTSATFSTALPAYTSTPVYLLGSDFLITITPQGGAATPLSGRQVGVSIKVDRAASPFEASGDGLTSGSVQAGKLKYSVSLTIMAQETDDVVGWFQNFTPMAISMATNAGATTAPYGLTINFPLARIKTKKLGNKADLVAWQLTFDQDSILQVGDAAALSCTLVNTCAAYLIPV